MRHFHYELIDSTSCEARRLADVHAGERFLVTAERQSAGRGRQGRSWHSPTGGAWLSLAWPTQREPRYYAPVSLAAAVAVRRALREVAAAESADFCIKWPNDILLAGRKVAGILCEQFPSTVDRRGILIVGIGVNVSFDPMLLGDDLRHPATTLASVFGREFQVSDVTAAVAESTSSALETFERDGLSSAILEELQENLAYIGTVQTWSSPRGTIRGHVLGIDALGRLRLELGGNEIACEIGELVRETSTDV